MVSIVSMAGGRIPARCSETLLGHSARFKLRSYPRELASHARRDSTETSQLKRKGLRRLKKALDGLVGL